jgi:hypothetical protein
MILKKGRKKNPFENAEFANARLYAHLMSYKFQK